MKCVLVCCASGLLLFYATLDNLSAQDFTYTNNNGAITITGYTGPGGDVTIPGAINGLPVTAIGDQAFFYCSGLSNVTITSAVTNIGNTAFLGCLMLNAITVDPLNPVYSSANGVCFNKAQTTLIQCPEGKAGSFSIPNTVTNIWDDAFNYCTSLTAISIPNSVTSIGDQAFIMCTSLTNVSMPNDLTSIGEEAFHGCHSLASVTIPSSVTSIGNYAFFDCPTLNAITVDPLNPVYSSVEGVCFNKTETKLIQCPEGKAGSFSIPNSVTNIGDYAFDNCSSLDSVSIPNSVTSIGDYAFSNCSRLSSVTIPSSVTSIGNYAFPGCSLRSVTIPSSVASIGDYAFASCNLTSIIIPSGVTNIGNYAFFNCQTLNAITVDPLNPAYSSANGVCFNKAQTTLIQFPEGRAGSFTVPNSVTNIVDGAFVFCGRLTSITLSRVTRIGDQAFVGCTSLTSISIPNSVTSIGDSAFRQCTSLASVTIPNTVTNIGNLAFQECSALASVSIPNSVTSIGDAVFVSCVSLTNISIPSSLTSIGDSAFSSCLKLNAITVDPLNPVYSSVDGVWFNKTQTTLIQCPQGKAGSYTIPNSVAGIGDHAFYSCTSLTSVTIPNSVTNIGDYAFVGCTSLNAITVDPLNTAYSSVDGVLLNKSQTTLFQCPQGKAGSFTVPNSVASIGDSAFDSCTRLTSITIPNSVASIGDSAFYSCTRLTSVTIPNSVTNIGDSAFESCGLTNVTIPKSVTSIGNFLFNACSYLRGIYFQGNAPSLIWYASLMAYDATVYYLPGTAGWGANFGGSRAVLWNPQPQPNDGNFGVRQNHFGFTITGTPGIPIVVEATTNLDAESWVPLQSCTLTNGLIYFSDVEWSNYSDRLYRIRSP